MRRVLSLFSLLLLLAPTAQGMARPAPPDSMRALVLFARFADDTSTVAGCSPASQDWRHPDVLPPLASTLLHPSGTPPFPETSLTAYFHVQSEGRFLITGDAYPDVVVTPLPEDAYDISRPQNTTALARLTRDLLDQVDPQVDFSAYDANQDGQVDHVFIILRRNSQYMTWSGYSVLGFEPEPLRYDGVRLDWNRSGSYVRYGNAGNIYADLNLTRLLAHELGHDLWADTPTRGHHLMPSRSRTDNTRERLGYALMVGGSTYDARGDQLIAAAERDLLGWIDCPVLRSDTTVVLGDLYTTGDCARYRISSQPERTVYLSNRQRLGPFDVLRTNTCTDPPNDQGLMTTGLLVTYRDGPRHFGVIPADTTLALSTQASTYDGDLFTPGRALTPWTRPTSTGRTRYTPQERIRAHEWQALTTIQTQDTTTLAVTYTADYRKHPVIRQNAFIGSESDGTRLEGTLHVVPEGQLTMASATTLLFSESYGVLLEGMATVEAPLFLRAEETGVAREGVPILVRDEGHLVVDGRSGHPVWTLPPGTTLDLGATGRLTLRDATLRLQPGAVLIYRSRDQIRFEGSEAELVLP